MHIFTQSELNDYGFVAELLKKKLEQIISRTGLYARVFSRVKTADSINNKFKVKNYCDSKKMQDLFGVRIAFYFKDDITVFQKIIEDCFTIVDKAVDEINSTEFKPTRLNLVCTLPKDITEDIDEQIFKCFIDKTFEIQIRTVFSEGWHEIDHDLRYKRKSEWDNSRANIFSRELNGIFATLETCDSSIIHLFERWSLYQFNDRNIESMIINKFRLKFTSESLSSQLHSIIENDEALIKKIYDYERNDAIWRFYKSGLPININNLIYLINYASIHNSAIDSETPSIVRKKLSQ